MTEPALSGPDRDLDLAAIRASVVKHCKDYLSEVPVAERSPSMLKAIVDVLTELGGAVEQDQARHARAKLSAMQYPFQVDADGNEVPHRAPPPPRVPAIPSRPSPASGDAVQGLDL